MKAKFVYLDDDDLSRELDDILANPEEWLAAPNENFGGRRPVDLVGTDDEHLIYEWIAAVKCGLIS